MRGFWTDAATPTPGLRKARASFVGRSSRVGFASILGAVTIAALVVFHGVLLAGRFADATLAHPEVLAQWFAALLLLLGAFGLRRQGSSLLSGRGALVFWLLVLLLHVGFGSGLTLAGDEPSGARELLLLLPFVAFSVHGAVLAPKHPGRAHARAFARMLAPLARFLQSPPPARLGLGSAGPGQEAFSPRPPPLS